MSQFATYVQEKNLSVDQIFYSSARIERHRVEDRDLRVRREALRRQGQGSAYADAGIAKPRSGRGVSRQRIAAALAGEPMAPRVRAKLARAVAALVNRRGVETPDVRQLFGDVRGRHHEALPAVQAGEQS
jgi:hypothetical protein